MKFSQKRPSGINWLLTSAFWNGFFLSPQSGGLFRIYINKIKIGGAGGDRGGGKTVNVGAVANTLPDVQGMFCLFVVLICGPNDTPLTWTEVSRGEVQISQKLSPKKPGWLPCYACKTSVSRADSTGRRLPIQPGFHTPQAAALAGLAAKAKLPGIVRKIDSFSLKNCKNST